MRIEIENLGALSVGKLDLADLTVICGENNTGKTYLTYALYGLLKTWANFVKLPEFDLQLLRENGLIEINLANRVIAHAPHIMQQAVDDYCVNLHRILAAQNDRFADTKIKVELNFKDVLLPEYKKEFTTDRSRRLISFVKQADSPILNISAATTETQGGAVSRFRYQPLIESVIKEICFSPTLPKPFIVSTERTGAVTFQSELNLSRNRLFDLAREVSGADAPEPGRLLDDVYGGGYPMPVKDNVDFINSLAEMQDQKSRLIENDPAILDDFETLIGGAYKLQREGLRYIPKGTRGVRLRMGESSSAARSLVILGYYLRHRAKPGDLLMIDEPELNLHPANQRRLARLLARLVNAGIKVFVTTHSDYIIKEFNLLIMLNNADDRLDAVRAKYHYASADRLAPERVRVYMLREEMALKSGNQRKTKARTLCEAPISSTLGIEVASFDDTIEEMNAMQDAIYYDLQDGGKA